MADADDILDAMETNATGPKQVTVDGQTVVQHSIDDQIKAANFSAGRTAKTKSHFGLRFSKMVPPGTG